CAGNAANVDGDRKRNRSQKQREPGPKTHTAQIAQQQARHRKSRKRVQTAASLFHPERKPGQVNNIAVLIDTDAQPLRRPGSAAGSEQLERSSQLVVDHDRQGNRSRQKEQRKGQRLQPSFSPKRPDQTGQHKDQRNARQKKLGSEFAGQQQPATADDQRQSPAVAVHRLGQGNPPPEPGDIQGQRWNQQPLRQVGIIAPVRDQPRKHRSVERGQQPYESRRFRDRS